MKLEQINISEKKTGTSKTGKEYFYYSVGIKIGADWHNSMIFEEDIETYKSLKVGDEIECTLYKEDFKGKEYSKFKDLKTEDKLDRVLKGMLLINEKLDKLLSSSIV